MKKYFIKKIFNWLSIEELSKRTINKNVIENELIQIRSFWDAHGDNKDVNKWSKVHPRFMVHDGCIVDLGCAGWNLAFEDKTSDNWAGYFFGKKEL